MISKNISLHWEDIIIDSWWSTFATRQECVNMSLVSWALTECLTEQEMYPLDSWTKALQLTTDKTWQDDGETIKAIWLSTGQICSAPIGQQQPTMGEVRESGYRKHGRQGTGLESAEWATGYKGVRARCQQGSRDDNIEWPKIGRFSQCIRKHRHATCCTQ